MQSDPVRPREIAVPAADGFLLRGHAWEHVMEDRSLPPVVIINPATSVVSRYYHRFAAFLHEHGFNVVTYDYRGIGGSRPHRLRGFQASWLDWGTKDFEGILSFARSHFRGHAIRVAAHSVGGFLIGMAPSSRVIDRIFTMGAQFAYWRDYAAAERAGMYVRWHLVMPALTGLFGYFPGKRLGWLEDTPAGVVHDWTAAEARFEDIYKTGSQALAADERAKLAQHFSSVTAPTLALSVSDDGFGTVPAVHRLLQYYTRSPRTHMRIAPASIGAETIGHFAFFNARFARSLWRIPLAWLRDGVVTDDITAEFIAIERE